MSPEMKALHGILENNDDGFTYVAGRHKAGRIKRTRNKNQTARCMRNDKRSVKQAENRRIFREERE